ncbi:hypothetical protein BW723_15605 [Polaribacter reichenbachii]|uniref:DUF1853 domain-containing protein n=1 Tax=Polaribacter reichenbachii TaxID=996801 RepID=A0A1B8U586_9FLAO|nr:DUF1853 family protein [Polaribacter reichenbachii]APZ47625.1 hypothetical protein BW723_15605 [Polaribacter reichenbachii]AUC18265.1 hypothetical protein BTO17_06050 [Polaribacter reichenbachii]OBY67022.1 hypothetical protein LPB301_04180 [Polaribacter reichenbachii]
MHQKTKDIQNRYDGFLQTPSLWKNKDVYELHQFKIEPKTLKIDFNIDEKLRLGKYIERFVSYQLAQEKDINILCENIQIQQNRITLGELDCILLKDKKPIHLEVIYKFYLFDDTVGTTEIDHFIGPNRKDALVEKLTKLKEKQLPLLYSNECENYLKSIHLSSEKIEQQVYFKAQLFVPYAFKNMQLKTLNTDCISGFYINQKELTAFNDCKFFIPNKKDWLVNPHQNVKWFNYTDFKEKSAAYLARNFSPLCWLKMKNGEIFKFFLVWWN